LVENVDATIWTPRVRRADVRHFDDDDADGRVTLPGPDVRRLPTSVEGTHRVLLRVEASDDRENDSNLSDAGAGTGILHNGAVAGFPLPMLRYVVAGEGARTPVDGASGLRLFGPRDGDTLSNVGAFTLMWAPNERARTTFYRVELETDKGDPLLSALLPLTARRYDAPSWIAERAKGRAVRWRVTGLSSDGARTVSSVWRSVRIPATLQASSPSGDSPRPRQ